MPGIERIRAQVISHPLARGLSPDEVREFLERLPNNRFPGVVYAARGTTPCIQPRGGFPQFESQLKLTRQLSQAGADFIPLTIDSYTRHNQYDTATQLLRRSEEEGKDYLNGYPLVSHGHELTRELYVGIDKPISLRHGTPDARLLVEVALASESSRLKEAASATASLFGRLSLDRSLLYWQYVDRICAMYSRDGFPVHRESFGPLSATMVPPAIAVAVEVIESLLAAEQGVKSFAVSFGQTGSLIQDLATATVLRTLSRHYLDQCGFGDVKIHLVYHQWMGQFPQQREKPLLSLPAPHWCRA
ncbi:MAG: hypothetical protein IPN24_13530 [Betaproteobacteria bacterium]|nr:hypothetical protein [Betaproteobacteria bacterium]